MNKKIVFGSNELVVNEVYAYKYSNGKVVLRVMADENKVTEADMKLLKDNKFAIDYYEQEVLTDPETNTSTTGDWVKKITYENYISGEYVSSYQNGQYTAEVTRLGELEMAVQQNAADIQFLAIMASVEL